MILSKELQRMKKLESKVIMDIKKVKRFCSSRIVRRGKKGATMYALIPKKLRKGIKPKACIVKRINKKKRTLFIFEVKK